MLVLKHGLAFDELYSRDGLLKVDAAFLAHLKEADAALADRLAAARCGADGIDLKTESALLIDLAPHVEDFISGLFGIEAEAAALRARHHQLAPLYDVKRLFVQRQAVKQVKPAEAEAVDGAALGAEITALIGGKFSELAFARAVQDWQKDEAANAERLKKAALYAAWATVTAAGQAKHGRGLLFKQPKKIDPEHLVPVVTAEAPAGHKVHTLDEHHLRRREGFALTDPGTDLAGALDHANYCIWCHHQGKDSCSKGLRDKAKPGEAAGAFKKSPFGVTLAGCPLEEKISEFHEVKTKGFGIGALGIICVDNPLAAATGHRICNDCMKSCIYQKQEPVNIPEAETRTLKDVLELPYGFEIYSLLTRWNPLDIRRPYPKPPTGKRVLVVGLGPAGFSLAHHLMNDGHRITGIDGLKIEPLPGEISGIDQHGKRVPFRPIRDVAELWENLDDRVMAGFGGVAEYGITVRWNKNFLKVIRLLLERREAFRLYGGVRFGGTLTAAKAFELGFDHIALAAGAGKPTVLDMPNGLARGVRTASDFLMALQLTGAAKKDSIANMQLRLPVVVVGGGLTAIDTATESLAYYPVQVEKFLSRYEVLVAEKGEAAVRARWNPEEAEVAAEFIAHARAIREERAAAKREGRAPHVVELLQGWGGVTLAYRKRLIDSPSYTLNHEEVEKALEEGIRFAEGLTPERVEVDARGAARSIVMKAANGTVELPARTILVAAGTQPNTVLAREDAEVFKLDGRYFQACDEEGNPVKPERAISKPTKSDILLTRWADGRFVSFFGDLHPSFFGNVVKAMGGVKQSYPIVSRVLGKQASASKLDDAAFTAHLDRQLRPRVAYVERLTPTIIEVVVEAPLAAERFEPGQFYRLQNYETNAMQVDGTRLAMEGLALTGAWVDKAKGLVSVIVLEMGGSSDLCAYLKPGEPVILMGPTGSPTEIEAGETVALVGGGLGNAVLFSIGQAYRAKGSKVLYFAGYKRVIDRYKVAEIEKAADVVVWCCDEEPGFEPTRPQDKAFVGNIVQAMAAHASGALGPTTLSLKDADRLIAIGSDRMMAAVTAARHGVLQPHVKPGHVAIGSINSPMQCMMKEICAQCLQPHKDPVTGEESYVFSCFNQDQPLDQVVWPALNQRLQQNGVQEKLTAQWIDRCLTSAGVREAAA
jgi:NADPH-dependent glutamate synthase beta subunit-like oxidoreductase/NAD(P)H-flavin reductase